MPPPASPLLKDTSAFLIAGRPFYINIGPLSSTVDEPILHLGKVLPYLHHFLSTCWIAGAHTLNTVGRESEGGTAPLSTPSTWRALDLPNAMPFSQTGFSVTAFLHYYSIPLPASLEKKTVLECPDGQQRVSQEFSF